MNHYRVLQFGLTVQELFRKKERRLYSYIPYDKEKNQQRISPVGDGIEQNC